ncbi:MAG: hypothetical protein NZ765_11060, partial [Anaerolineae bacterium]|nr:hypothetical protein [Anaerolineae bacterium]
PLVVYFISHPYAFTSRVEAISLPEEGLGNTLITNLSRLLLIQFGGGIWLGQWPSLSPFFGIPMLTGLLVCMRNLRRGTAWFVLIWLVLGWSPVLLSRQNWDATTTILRGIVAWPVVCLLAALGITTLVTSLFSRLNRKEMSLLRDHDDIAPMIPSLLLLALGGTTTSVQYFGIWASEHDIRGRYTPALIQHLNHGARHHTLCPRKLCGNPTNMFLLQARYPVLSSLLPEQVLTRLDTNMVDIILPYENGEKIFSNWYLLEPRPDGNGDVYLLPPLSGEHIETLAASTRGIPCAVLATAEDQPVVRLCALERDIIRLWAQLPPLHPIEAHWKDELALTGYAVQPALVRRGREVALYLSVEGTAFRRRRL